MVLPILTLISCLIVVDDGVYYDCTCDVVYDDYFYYDLRDVYGVSECRQEGQLPWVTDDVAADCVSDYSQGGYYYASCDCVCSESREIC